MELERTVSLLCSHSGCLSDSSAVAPQPGHNFDQVWHTPVSVFYFVLINGKLSWASSTDGCCAFPINRPQILLLQMILLINCH